MSTNDGGPAFPVVPSVNVAPGHYVSIPQSHPGMSLRDYLAANCPLKFATPPSAYTTVLKDDMAYTLKVDAAMRYAWADTMLQAREEAPQ